VGDLLGGGQVGHQRVGDAEAVGDDPADVDRRAAHPLDGRDDAEDAGHLVGVAG